MKTLSIPVVAFLVSVAGSASLFAGDAMKGAAALFDGKSLSGWTVAKPDAHFWAADKEGNLVCFASEADRKLPPKGKGKKPGRKSGGYIWTEKSYGDFALDLEFKVTPGCNSGVFIRTDPKNPVQGGFEVQVLDSAGKDELNAHQCGALYDALAPSVNASKPAGEWNHLNIRCRGPHIVVILNGQKVVAANLDRWSTPELNPDGSKNKFKTALKDLPREGHIGFQDHGHNVSFRNIKLKELK